MSCHSRADRITLKRHVLAFFQGNRYLLAGLVDHVASLIASSSRVIDLYAGVGLFAVAAVRASRATVVAVEGDRQAALDLEANAASSGGIEVVHQAVESFLERRRPAPDVAIVDPPRTGLSKDALAGLAGAGGAARRLCLVRHRHDGEGRARPRQRRIQRRPDRRVRSLPEHAARRNGDGAVARVGSRSSDAERRTQNVER